MQEFIVNVYSTWRVVPSPNLLSPWLCMSSAEIKRLVFWIESTFGLLKIMIFSIILIILLDSDWLQVLLCISLVDSIGWWTFLFSTMYPLSRFLWAVSFSVSCGCSYVIRCQIGFRASCCLRDGGITMEASNLWIYTIKHQSMKIILIKPL